MNQRNPTMKLIASTVVFTFFVTSLGITPNTFAATGVPTPEVSSLTAGMLAIPSELGQVTDTVMGDPTAPSFIHIQSAHGNYQAEKNIEKLLGYIEKNSTVKLMLLEGAADKLQPELFRLFPKHPDFNRKVTDKLMQEGYLTGPESFLIDSSNKTEGWGIENLDAYKKDREAFIRVVKTEKTAEKFLGSLRATIDRRFSSKLNKDLLNLVRQEEAFGSGTVSFESWIKTLGEGSKKHLKTDLSDAFYQDQYPFLIRYFRLQAIGSKIDREKARHEADAFLNELASRKVSKEILGNFKSILQASETDLLKTVSRTTDGYSTLRRAFDLAFDKLPKDFSMTQWPNWTLYAQYIILMQEMEGKGLHEETLKLKDKIQTALAQTADDKEYLAQSRQLYLLRRLFALELTRAEYEELNLAQSVKHEAESKTSEVGRSHSSEVEQVKSLRDQAMQFYAVAVEREQHMFSNALQQMSLQKQQRAVIVTGGFHADGLKKLAASKHSSYIQITPRIAEVTKRDHDVYLRSMLGSRDIETSQIPAPLGLMGHVQRVAVTGVAATKEWARDVRRIISDAINSEPENSGLKFAFSKSVFGTPAPALAPAMARAEVRNVVVSDVLQGTSPAAATGTQKVVIKSRSEMRDEPLDATEFIMAFFGLLLGGVIYGIFYVAVPFFYTHHYTHTFRGFIVSCFCGLLTARVVLYLVLMAQRNSDPVFKLLLEKQPKLSLLDAARLLSDAKLTLKKYGDFDVVLRSGKIISEYEVGVGDYKEEGGRYYQGVYSGGYERYETKYVYGPSYWAIEPPEGVSEETKSASESRSESRTVANRTESGDKVATVRAEVRLTPAQEKQFQKAMSDLQPKWWDGWFNGNGVERRIAAVNTLRKLKSVPELVKVLSADNYRVREAAIVALRELNALDELGKELNNALLDVREAAALALGDLKDPNAVPALMEALKDSYRSVGDAAAEALEKIGDPRAESALSAYKEMRAKERLARESELSSLSSDDYDGDYRQDSTIFRSYVPVGLFGGIDQFFVPGSSTGSAILLGIGIVLAIKQLRQVLALRDRTGNYQRYVEMWGSHLAKFNGISKPTVDHVLAFMVKNGPAASSVAIGLSFVNWTALASGAMGAGTFFITWVGYAFLSYTALTQLNVALVKRKKIQNVESTASDNESRSESRTVANRTESGDKVATVRAEVRLTPEQEKQFQKAMGDMRFQWLDLFRSSGQKVQRRVTAAEMLGQLKDNRAVSLLIHVLKRHRDRNEDQVFNAVVHALAEIKDPRAIFELIDALALRNLIYYARVASVRYGVLESGVEERESRGGNFAYNYSLAAALGSFAQPEFVAVLVDILNNEKKYYNKRFPFLKDSFYRPYAAKLLGMIHDSRVEQALEAAIKDERSDNYYVRKFAIKAAGKFKYVSAVPALMELLKDRDFRDFAAKALEEIGDPRSTSVLNEYKSIRASEEEASRIAESAKFSSPSSSDNYGDDNGIQISNPRYFSGLPLPLLGLAGDDAITIFMREHPIGIMIFGVAGMIAILLYVWNLTRPKKAPAFKVSRDVLSRLRTMLRDEDSSVNAQAVDYLVQYAKARNWKSFNALVGAYYDDAYRTGIVQNRVSNSTKALIVSRLGELGNFPAANKLLIEALDHPDREISTRAAEVLEEIKQENSSRSESRLTPAQEKQFQKAMSDIKPKWWEYLFGDAGWYRRETAAKTLRQLGDFRSVPALIKALNDRSRFVRAHAADALGQLKDLRAVPALIKAIKRNDYHVRFYIGQSLRLFADPRAASALEEYANYFESGITDSSSSSDSSGPAYRGGDRDYWYDRAEWEGHNRSEVRLTPAQEKQFQKAPVLQEPGVEAAFDQDSGNHEKSLLRKLRWRKYLIGISMAMVPLGFVVMYYSVTFTRDVILVSGKGLMVYFFLLPAVFMLVSYIKERLEKQLLVYNDPRVLPVLENRLSGIKSEIVASNWEPSGYGDSEHPQYEINPEWKKLRDRIEELKQMRDAGNQPHRSEVRLTPAQEKQFQRNNSRPRSETRSEMVFHVLKPLSDPDVRSVYTSILSERINPDILTDYYGLGGALHDYKSLGTKQLAGQMIDFLANQGDRDLNKTAEAFWENFGFLGHEKPAGRLARLDALEEDYLGIRSEKLDLLMIRDVLDQQKKVDWVFADIGAGRNHLGKAMLTFAKQHGIFITRIIGTDVNDWSIPSEDPRLLYRKQTDEHIPIDHGSVDAAIIKWALHHMTLEQLTNQAKEAAAILRPGGRLVIVEALRGNGAELNEGLEAEMQNAGTWPDGLWKERRRAITKRFLALSLEKQRQVLALEDYYGHLLENRRNWMPFPYNYLSVEEIKNLFSSVGLAEVPSLRRVFGFMPIIHRGPPSIRLVFEKKQTTQRTPTNPGSHTSTVSEVRNGDLDPRDATKRSEMRVSPETVAVAGKALKDFLPVKKTLKENQTKLAEENFELVLSRLAAAPVELVDPAQKKTLEDLLTRLYESAKPYFVKGMGINPIHHNTQVLDNAARIGVGEKLVYPELRNLLVLALLHDIGNAVSVKEKVKSKEIEDAKNSHPQIVRQLQEDSIAFRQEHMEKGPALAKLLLRPFVKEGLIAKGDVDDILHAIRHHDDPSIEKSYVELYPNAKGKHLFTFDGSKRSRLLGFLREADRFFMLTYQGVVQDLAGEGKEITAVNVLKRLDSNMENHKKEFLLYKNAGKSVSGFRESSLYRTETGQQMFLGAKAAIVDIFVESIRALTTQQIQALTNDQIQALIAQQIQALTEKQLEALTKEQLEVLKVNQKRRSEVRSSLEVRVQEIGNREELNVKPYTLNPVVDTTSLGAKIGTAIQVAEKMVSPLVSSTPAFAEEIKPQFFAGTAHYPQVSVVPSALATKWPVLSKMISRFATASTERMVIDQRQGVPDAASVLPLVTFALYNPKAAVVLALIADASEVAAFEKELAALSQKGVLPQNFAVRAFANENEFVGAFAGFYNSAAPLGQSVALITDRENSVVTQKIGSRRHLLSVVGAQNPLKQTASTLLAADKLLNESIWSMGYHFVSVEKLGGLEALMAELTSYVAAQARVLASA